MAARASRGLQAGFNGGSQDQRQSRDRLITTWAGTEQPPQRLASPLDERANKSVQEMKQKIQVVGLAPWTREVEMARRAAQQAYTEMMLESDDLPASQSIDDMWLKTSHFWINAFRAAAQRVEASIAAEGPSSTLREDHPLKREQAKIHVRFAQALLNEEATYRKLISSVVERWQLQPLVVKHLGPTGIKIRRIQASATSHHPPISAVEKQERVRLVSYALCSLGDMQRYSSQLKVQMDQAANRGGDSGKEPAEWEKARVYYDCARYIDPANGTAYHQLAVLCNLLKDEFGTTYYLIRAAQCKQPWAKIDDELASRMKKALDGWKVESQRRATGGAKRWEVEAEIKHIAMALIAMLYTDRLSSDFHSVLRAWLQTVENALRNRLLSSEAVAQITASLTGIHWHKRNNVSLIIGGKSAEKRQEAERHALRLVMMENATLFQSASNEVQRSLVSRPLHVTSAIMDDEYDLATSISPSLRRLLPSVRIASKWFKLNLDYLVRTSRTSQDALQPFNMFWDKYQHLIKGLIELFPIEQLPSIAGPLEEDLDLRGFAPLSRGLTTYGGRRIDDNEADTDDEVDDLPYGPDEEQLMRISDLQVEAKLIAQISSSMGLEATYSVRSPETAAAAREEDPVSMAFRAVVDDGGSIGYAPDGSSHAGNSTDDEEEILFRPQRPTPPQPPAAPPARPPPPEESSALHAMLQELTQSAQGQARSPGMPPPQSPWSRPEPPRPGGQSSPQGLFGVGNSMWTPTRAESEQGIARTTSQSGQPRVDLRSGHMPTDSGPSLVHPPINGQPRQSFDRQPDAANIWREASTPNGRHPHARPSLSAPHQQYAHPQPADQTPPAWNPFDSGLFYQHGAARNNTG